MRSSLVSGTFTRGSQIHIHVCVLHVLHMSVSTHPAGGRTVSSGLPPRTRQETSRSVPSRSPPRILLPLWTELQTPVVASAHRRDRDTKAPPTPLTFDPLPSVQLDLPGPLRDVGPGGDEGASRHGAVQPPLPHLGGRRGGRRGAGLRVASPAWAADRQVGGRRAGHRSA